MTLVEKTFFVLPDRNVARTLTVWDSFAAAKLMVPGIFLLGMALLEFPNHYLNWRWT